MNSEELQRRSSTSNAEGAESHSGDSFWHISQLLPWGRRTVVSENISESLTNMGEAQPVPWSIDGTQPEAKKSVMDSPLDVLRSGNDGSQEEPVEETPDSVLWRKEDTRSSQNTDKSDGIFLVESDGVYTIDQSTVAESDWKPSSWMDPWLDNRKESHVQNEDGNRSIGASLSSSEGTLKDETQGKGKTISSNSSSTASQSNSLEEEGTTSWVSDVPEATLHSNVDDSRTSQLAKIAVIGTRRQYEPLN